MSSAEFMSRYGTKLLLATGTHFLFVAVSVSIGFTIALILGIVLSRLPAMSRYIMPVLSVVQTIPGIVFIGILFIYMGMVPATAITALSIYAIFPILKNTYAGIIGVAAEYKEAALGCGMSDFQVLTQVELPLALPAIIGGLRLSTVYTVSWAVLVSMIGLGGLGEFIYIGISSNNNVLIITGAIPAAVMAICLSRLIDALKRRLLPKPLRGVSK
jgi:osmoprotectant transport system permease protein